MAIPSASSHSEKLPTSTPLIGRGWAQGVALVMVFGFLAMGILAYRTYTASMPLPAKVIDESGEVLFTGAEITRGQELYQARGLMQYGSVLGHGAYLGPDYTAEYLRMSTEDVGAQWRAQGVADAKERVVTEFRANRYNPGTKTLVFTDKQAAAFDRIQHHYADYFGENSTKYGLLPHMITDKAEIHDLTAFFAWTAWASAAQRPGHHYSYTNNWPAEQRVDNGPTAQVIVWSALSLIALLGGIGIMFAVYGRWSQKIGWHGDEASTLSFREPGEVSLTPSQRATIWFFAIVSVLFLAQTLVGAAAEHYRADLSTFFGLDLARLLPYNLARTWHVQLALFWTAAAFLAGGIFLVPFISRREPRRQSWLAYGLLGAVALVVFGVRSWLKTPAGRMKWDTFKLRMPVMGKLLYEATLSRINRSMAISLSAGLPMTQTLAVIARSSGNVFMSERIQMLATNVERGESLHRAASASGLFSPLVLQMIAIGEETGALPELLDEAAGYYEREVDHALKNLSSSIEPILIVGVGGMVLVLALGIFMPLWEVIAKAGQG